MARLPSPGGDNNNWGTVLNDYLNQSHNTDGTLKPAAVTAAGAISDATVVHNSGNESIAGVKTFTSSPVVPTPTNPTDATNKTYVDTTAATKIDKTTLTQDGNILTRAAGVPSEITRTTLAQDTAFSSTYSRKVAFDPRDFGATGGSNDTAAFVAAAAAANAVGGVLLIPLGRWNVPGGLDLSSYFYASIVGHGCSELLNGNLTGSVLVDTAQTGAVLKIGARANNHTGRIVIGGFGIEGDNTAGSAKKGIVCSAVTGVTIERIVVKNTGGAPFDFGSLMLSTVQDTIARQPVSAAANDVPYYMGSSAMNGNRFIGCGLRSVSTAPDATSCVRFVDDGTWAPEHNLFMGWWFEYQHVPSGGTLFLLKGNDNVISDFQYQDVNCVSNVATSFVRFQSPSVGVPDFGGNTYRGYLPGSLTANSNTGVRLSQSGNVVIATKGYQGKNVTIDATIGRSTIHLMGGEANATDVGVINNSALSTNTWIDGPSRNETHMGGMVWRLGVENGSMQLYRSDGGAPSIEFASTGTGPRIFCVSGDSLLYRADDSNFQDVNSVSMARFNRYSGVQLSGGASGKVGFYGTTPIVRPTGTPAAATDLATALTLLNDLRTKLIALGLIA